MDLIEMVGSLPLAVHSKTSNPKPQTLNPLSQTTNNYQQTTQCPIFLSMDFTSFPDGVHGGENLWKLLSAEDDGI